jgi:hypothetical protein
MSQRSVRALESMRAGVVGPLLQVASIERADRNGMQDI